MARRARFDCVAGTRSQGVSTPPWPGQEVADLDDGPWFSWRLLGRNNRELGRSPQVYQQAEQCHRAIQGICERVGDLVAALTADPATGRWGWRLVLDGEPTAVSARTYFRQREVHYAVQLFCAWIDEARAGKCRRPGDCPRAILSPPGPSVTARGDENRGGPVLAVPLSPSR